MITAVKDKPILFSTPMIKAILEGRKTQTRRVCKLEGLNQSDLYENRDGDLVNPIIYSPYQVGQRLWVRETHYRYGHWQLTGKLTDTGKPEWEFMAEIDSIRYFENPPSDFKVRPSIKTGWFKRPSIFMPHWAFRITLEVTEVRVQRLQEITQQDAFEEGMTRQLASKLGLSVEVSEESFNILDCRRTFHALWDSINSKRGYSWESNPWCWCISFKVVK